MYDIIFIFKIEIKNKNKNKNHRHRHHRQHGCATRNPSRLTYEILRKVNITFKTMLIDSLEKQYWINTIWLRLATVGCI